MTQSQVLVFEVDLVQCLELGAGCPHLYTELCPWEGLTGPAKLFCRSCSGHTAAWITWLQGQYATSSPCLGEEEGRSGSLSFRHEGPELTPALTSSLTSGPAQSVTTQVPLDTLTPPHTCTHHPHLGLVPAPPGQSHIPKNPIWAGVGMSNAHLGGGKKKDLRAAVDTTGECQLPLEAADILLFQVL